MKTPLLVMLVLEAFCVHHQVRAQTITKSDTNINSKTAVLNITRSDVNDFSMATFIPVSSSVDQSNGDFNYNYFSLGSALSEPPYCNNARIVFVKNEIIFIKDASNGNLIKTINNTLAIKSFSLAKNGKLLFCSDYSNNVSLWDLFDNRLILRFRDKTGPISISPDGQKLLMCVRDSAPSTIFSIQIYDITSQSYIFSKHYNVDSIVKGSFSLENSDLLLSFSSSRAEYWNYKTNELLLQWNFDRPNRDWYGENFIASFWNDSKKVIISGYKNKKITTEIWDFTTKKILVEVPIVIKSWTPAKNGTDILFMNDSTLFHVNTEADQKIFPKFNLPRTDKNQYEKIVSAFISSDYRHVTVITSKGRLFDLTYHNLTLLSESEISIASYSEIKMAKISPDNKKMLFFNFNYFDGSRWGILDFVNNEIQVIQDSIVINRAKVFRSYPSSSLLFIQSYYNSDLWNTLTGRKIKTFLGTPQQSGISPDLKIIVDGEGHCYDIEKGKIIADFNYHSRPNTIAFFPDGQLLVAKFDDQKFQICNLHNGRVIYDSKLPTKAYYNQTRKRRLQNLDERFAHIGDRDQNIHRLENFENNIAVSPNGEFIAMSNFHDVHLFDKDGRFLRTLVADDSDALATVVSLTFTPGSDKIIAGYQYGSVFQWDLSGKEIGRYLLLPVGYGNEIYTTNDEIKKIQFFNKQGDFYALSANGILQIISKHNKALEKIVPVHSKESVLLFDQISGGSGEVTYISDCSISEDGKWFATCGKDHSIEVWNCLTGEMKLYNAETNVTHVAFSEDNRQLFISLESGVSAIIDLKREKQICKFLSFSNNKWYVISDDFRFDTNDPESMDEIAWNFSDEPMSSLGAEVYMRDYYTPGLLGRTIFQNASIFSVPDITNLNRARPIISRLEVLPRGEDVVNVRVTVINQGIQCSILSSDTQRKSGAYDIRLFRNSQLVGEFPDQEASFNDNRDTIRNIYKKKSLIEWRQSASVLSSNNDTVMIEFTNIHLPESIKNSPVRFSAYAFNADRVKGNTKVEEFINPGTLKHKKRAFVVSIGISQTQNGWNLATPMLDALSLAKEIPSELSGKFDKIITFTLVSTSNPAYSSEIQPTKENIRFLLEYLATGKKRDSPNFPPDQLKRLDSIEPIGPDDIIIITFSGHGFATEKSLFYLVPFNTGTTIGLRAEDIRLYLNEGNKEGVAGAASFIQKCISSAELLSWLKKMDANNITLVIDACYAGAIVGSEENFRPGPMGDPGFGQFAYDKGIVVLTASQAKEISIANLGTTHGLLTSALLKSENSFCLQAGDFTGWINGAMKDVPIIFRNYYPHNSRGDYQTPMLFDFRKSKQ